MFDFLNIRDGQYNNTMSDTTDTETDTWFLTILIQYLAHIWQPCTGNSDMRTNSYEKSIVESISVRHIRFGESPVSFGIILIVACVTQL